MRSVADDLAARGVVSDADHLYWLARWEGKAGLKAGEYRLQAGITPTQALDILISGESISHQVTFVEGWQFREWRAALARNEVLVQTLQERGDDEIMALLDPEGRHPEGLFYPDTWHFDRGMSDLDLLRRAYRRMETVLAEEWEQRAEGLPLKTPYEALILASIVEKETGLAEERAAIAGVFTRRLQRGMKLQTDPTVIYGMGERFDGNIRRRDLREDTPYNTYVHKGLPPTPICMPGRAAIHAALHPADGKALYFVARGDGGHVFSATLKEHNAAVRKYQLKK